MSVCLLVGAQQIVFATSAFMLAWTHSVEKVRWEEDWRVTPAGLEIAEARISGSGAGMEPPDDAVFDGRYWRYRPKLAPQQRVVLARSGATGGGWKLCYDGRCHDLPEQSASDPVMTLEPCR
jgi:hypothetical protein